MFRNLYLSYLQLNYPDRRVSELAVHSLARNAGYRIVARMLLFAYALLILRPVMPIIADKAAHAFWSNVHLRTVHKVAGKEHVHYQLCKAANENRQDKGTAKQKFSPGDEACLIALPALKAYIFPNSNPPCADPLFYFPASPEDPDYIPPRA